MLHMRGDNENSIRAMQHFMSEGKWDDRLVLKKHWQLVDEAIGGAAGVLVIDCSGFPKQQPNFSIRRLTEISEQTGKKSRFAFLSLSCKKMQAREPDKSKFGGYSRMG